VRWYCKFGISYRDLEDMMSERGVAVDHTTLFRWVQRYAPLMEKRIRWYQRYTDASWRVDETYVKVAGEWHISTARSTRTARLLISCCRRERRPNQLGVSLGRP
jgi:transposase, IS6 family